MATATEPAISQNATDVTSSSGTEVMAPKITFLVIFLLFGLIGNLMLIVTIAHYRKVRGSPMYLFTLNLAVANLCECALNMTILLGSSILEDWEFGSAMCTVNAFLMNLICIEMTLGLTMLATDRMLSMKLKDKYESILTLTRVNLMIAYTWFQSLCFSFPILAGVVPSSVFSSIYLCIVSQNSSLVYNVITTIFCFLVPLAISISFFIYIIKTAFRERHVVRAMLAQNHYADSFVGVPKFWKEITGSKFAGTVFIVWFLLQVPYIVTSFIRRYQYSYELDSLTSTDITYAWQVDVVIIWLRFSYVIVLPVAAYTWSKELWRQCKDLVICRKSNSVVDASGKPPLPDDKENVKCDEEKKQKINDKNEKAREAFVHNSGFQVPVLFATAKGVHVQTYDSDDGSESGEFDYSEKSDSKHIRGKKCDVIEFQEQIHRIGDDTSDYDSGNEIDPFSVSHPVTTKNLKNSRLAQQGRSNSQPEVSKTNQSLTSGLPTANISASSAADSGLDISAGNSSRAGLRVNPAFNRLHSAPASTEKISKEKDVALTESSEMTRTQKEPNELHKPITGLVKIFQNDTGSSENNTRNNTGGHETIESEAVTSLDVSNIKTPKENSQTAHISEHEDSEDNQVLPCTRTISREGSFPDQVVSDNMTERQQNGHSTVWNQVNENDSGASPQKTKSRRHNDVHKNLATNAVCVDDRTLRLPVRLDPLQSSTIKPLYKSQDGVCTDSDNIKTTSIHANAQSNTDKQHSDRNNPLSVTNSLQDCFQGIVNVSKIDQNDSRLDPSENLTILNCENPSKDMTSQQNHNHSGSSDPQVALQNSGTSDELRSLADDMYGEFAACAEDVITPSDCQLSDSGARATSVEMKKDQDGDVFLLDIPQSAR